MLASEQQILKQGEKLPQLQGSPSGRSIPGWRGEEADAPLYSEVTISAEELIPSAFSVLDISVVLGCASWN